MPSQEPVPSQELRNGPPRQAVPKDVLAQAKRHFELGVSFFQQGRMGSAREEFEEAYRLSRAPDLLFNLALVAVELDRPEEALQLYERYLASARPRDRAEVVKAMDLLRRRIEQQREIERAARLLAAPPPPPPRRPWGAVGLLAGGGAVLLSGIAVSVAGAAIITDINSGPYYDPAGEARARSLSQAGAVLSATGAAAAIGGGAWLLWHRLRRGQERRLTVTPSGTGLSWRF